MNIFKKMCVSFIIAAFISVPLFSVKEAEAAVTVLSVGSSGPQVVELQRNLRSLGYFTYSTNTGYYGYTTRNSVYRFQKAFGLNADGIAGPNTVGKLNNALKANSISAYAVKWGDSLFEISTRYGMTVGQLKALNGLTGSIIYPGQVLNVKTSAQSQAAAGSLQAQNPDIYWLSRIIEAEAQGEPYTGKVAVGNVIMNRVASPDFPNTIKGVIFEYFQGIPQFSPVEDGSIYNTPSADSIRAAQDALNGVRPVGSATYFFNPDKSTATWIVSNKAYVTQIGEHVFYR